MEKTNKMSFYGLLGLVLLSTPAIFAGRCGGCCGRRCAPVRKPVQQRPAPCVQQVRPTVSAVVPSKVQETNRLVAQIKPYFPREDAKSFTAFQCKTHEERRKQFQDVRQLIEALPRMTPATEFKKWQRIFNEALILGQKLLQDKKRDYSEMPEVVEEVVTKDTPSTTTTASKKAEATTTTATSEKTPSQSAKLGTSQKAVLLQATNLLKNAGEDKKQLEQQLQELSERNEQLEKNQKELLDKVREQEEQLRNTKKSPETVKQLQAELNEVRGHQQEIGRLKGENTQKTREIAELILQLQTARKDAADSKSYVNELLAEYRKLEAKQLAIQKKPTTPVTSTTPTTTTITTTTTAENPSKKDTSVITKKPVATTPTSKPVVTRTNKGRRLNAVTKQDAATTTAATTMATSSPKKTDFFVPPYDDGRFVSTEQNRGLMSRFAGNAWNGVKVVANLPSLLSNKKPTTTPPATK